MRPKSLAEVAELTARSESFDLCLRNFLDGFYAAPGLDALQAEPRKLTEQFPETGAIQDAYLAAVAEKLAGENGLPAPEWAFRQERKLKHPWFALPLHSLRAILLVESPAAFRSRNLFVSENALSRA
jgi:hypothetical protein